MQETKKQADPLVGVSEVTGVSGTPFAQSSDQLRDSDGLL